MKKLFASILLLVYFTVTTGFVVSVHYCMNKRSSIEIGYSGKRECDKCGMNLEKSGGCCKDDVQVIKMKTDHTFATSFALSIPAAIVPTANFSYLIAAPIVITHYAFAFSNGPPLDKQDTYLVNGVFRL